MGCTNQKFSPSPIQRVSDPNKGWFDEIDVGEIHCNNRIFMASMTRLRGTIDGQANNMVRIYYSQRSSFGLIITEGSPISKQGMAYFGQVCIFNQKQCDEWKKVVDSIHEKGGKIVIQLFHAGRATHRKITGQPEIAPSPIAIQEKIPQLGGQDSYPTPQEMTLDNIGKVKEEYKQAAIFAKQAGFDGVELSAANGTLVDQFLKDGTNKRKDKYGSSFENRCRFCLEVLDELIKVFGANRVGLKISPLSRQFGMNESNPQTLFSYLLIELQVRFIAFIEIREPQQSDKYQLIDLSQNQQQKDDNNFDAAKNLRQFFKGIIIGNENYAYTTGLNAIQFGYADAISFARYAICNPDLVKKFKEHTPIDEDYDYSTFFGGGFKGYIDYPQNNQNQKEDNQVPKLQYSQSSKIEAQINQAYKV
eukprot:TRINITY_DN7200_c0_g1_i1.p1 TRINITY_DN7200_c0_g1~~TRINITY_DN7200_c0_g1_i1.p1  ORF type:complete len:419 (+),score=77.63 TRINITY_DN7200_c0_g1_i1:155-1411(+)